MYSLDTAGTEQFGKHTGTLTRIDNVAYLTTTADPVAMRDLYIKSGHGFLLVFSITSMSSFAELSAIRDEIIHVKDDEFVPMVIVGNKADLEDAREVPKPRAFALSQLWMVPYYETSAKRKCEYCLLALKEADCLQCEIC